MNNHQCPHCGSFKEPANKPVWSSKDKVVVVILFLLFFPANLVFAYQTIWSQRIGLSGL